VGVLLLGVSNHEISRNTVADNEFVGIAVLGWCTATSTNPSNNCVAEPPQADPSVNDNLVSLNKMSGNGLVPPVDPPFDAISFLAADITYFSAGPAAGEFNSGNCFEKNKPEDGFTFVSSEPDFLLPTDGC
jgi:hypothetical protein